MPRAKKKLAIQRVAEGGDTRHKDDLVIAPAHSPMLPENTPCPDKNKQVAKVWKDLCLEWRHILRVQDKHALLDYCRQWVITERLWAVLSKEGVIKKKRAGQKRSTHELLKQYNDARKELFSLWKEFGLTPTSREVKQPAFKINNKIALELGIEKLQKLQEVAGTLPEALIEHAS